MISWLGKPIILILDIIGIACLLWNTEMKIKSLLNILMNNGNCIVVRKTLPALLFVCVCVCVCVCVRARASQSHTRIASLFNQSKGFVSETVVT